MKNILVVDDEVDVQILFEQRFRREIKNGDCTFKFALSADGALEYLKENVDLVDLVLSDINMPGKTGLELLKKIKEGFVHPPPVVMMITAYGDDENYKRAIELGADDFFTKPLDFTKLKERINKL
jgi:CheY-like chemotaxis protein